MNTLLLLLISILPYPDGTLVFSNKPGTIIGEAARVSASKAQGYPAKWTHVGIIFDGVIYHSDFPVVTKRTKLKPGERAIFVLPNRYYTPGEIKTMKNYAESQLGKRYSLRGYRLRNGEEGWCSTFVGNVLNQTGHNITKQQRFTPDNLMRAVR